MKRRPKSKRVALLTIPPEFQPLTPELLDAVEALSIAEGKPLVLTRLAELRAINAALEAGTVIDVLRPPGIPPGSLKARHAQVCASKTGAACDCSPVVVRAA